MAERKKFRRASLLILMLIMLFSISTSASAAIRLSATRVAMSKGRTYTLKVTGTTARVTFASANKAIATVTSKGVITGRSKGTTDIYAVVANQKYKCTVMVRQPVESVTMKYSKIKISKNKTFQLAAQVLPATANNKTLAWTSSNPKVVKVDSNGKITTLASGTATITAKATDVSGKYSRTVVEVKSSATVTPPPNPTQTSMSRRYLNSLAAMSKAVEADYKAGRPWKYVNGGGGKTTFEDARASVRYCDCALLARYAMRQIGILDTKTNWWGVIGGGIHFGGSSERQIRAHCQIIEAYKTPQQLVNEGKLLPGDICTWVGIQHTNIYAGNGKWYDAGRMSGQNGFGTSNNYTFTTWGPINGIGMTGQKVGNIIRVVK